MFVCIHVCICVWFRVHNCMYVYVCVCRRYVYIYIIHTYVCVRITLLYHPSCGGLQIDWTVTPFVHRRLNPPSSWPSLGSTSSSSWDWWRLSGGQMLGRTHTRNGQLKENSWLNDFQSMDCSLNFRPHIPEHRFHSLFLQSCKWRQKPVRDWPFEIGSNLRRNCYC